MRFKDLYEFALDGKAKSDQSLVSVTKLAHQVKARHEEIGDINFWPASIDENVILGYMTFDYDRASSREEEYKIIDIKYSRTLNFCWRRFVCCKELMHAFDNQKERTNSKVKLQRLLSELETTPMSDDFSAMLSSEFRAEWMALICLCPKPVRDQITAQLQSKDITPLQAAEKIKVPEMVINAVTKPYYDQALDEFLSM